MGDLGIAVNHRATLELVPGRLIDSMRLDAKLVELPECSLCRTVEIKLRESRYLNR
jgi:hypothetical protein